jgi:hypothetical protein
MVGEIDDDTRVWTVNNTVRSVTGVIRKLLYTRAASNVVLKATASV